MEEAESLDETSSQTTATSNFGEPNDYPAVNSNRPPSLIRTYTNRLRKGANTQEEATRESTRWNDHHTNSQDKSCESPRGHIQPASSFWSTHQLSPHRRAVGCKRRNNCRSDCREDWRADWRGLHRKGNRKARCYLRTWSIHSSWKGDHASRTLLEHVH